MSSPTNIVASTVLTADGTVAAGPCYLFGWSIRETAAAAATVLIRTTSTSGAVIAHVNLAASSSENQWFGPQGVWCPEGIYFDEGTGAVDAVVYIGR